VLLIALGGVVKPLASVSGVAALLVSLAAFESGDCCIIKLAMV